MIETRGLRFAYPGHPHMDFGDVAVAKGGTLLLQGPSGSGKSTWLALVAGLLTAAEGEVLVAGQSLKAMATAQRDRWRAQHIGFLPQKLHLSSALTVRENLELAYFAAGLPVDRLTIEESLARLDLAAFAARRPTELSGGQAQRVALARAVIMRPLVVLADEPTASLDDQACAAGLSLLAQTCQASGATLVVATHDARVRQSLPAAQVLVFQPLGQEALA